MFRFAQASKTLAAVARCAHITRPAVSAFGPLTQQKYGFSTSLSHRSDGPSYYESIGTTKPPEQLTKKTVEERVLKAIKAWDRFPQDRLDKLTLDARFVEDLGLDSLDLVEITMSLENEFGFEIPEADVDKLKTPRHIFQYVCEHQDVYE